MLRARLSSAIAGRDLDDFFARYVDGTDEIPLADALAADGVRVNHFNVGWVLTPMTEAWVRIRPAFPAAGSAQ